MRVGTVGFALVAGLAAFLVVGAVGTELGSAAGIEFSPFVGVPAGLVAGVAVATVVLLGFEDHRPARRRPAVAFAGFGAAFVVVLHVAIGAFRLRNSVALPVAAAGGLSGAVPAYLRSGGDAADGR